MSFPVTMVTLKSCKYLTSSQELLAYGKKWVQLVSSVTVVKYIASHPWKKKRDDSPNQKNMAMVVFEWLIQQGRQRQISVWSLVLQPFKSNLFLFFVETLLY